MPPSKSSFYKAFGKKVAAARDDQGDTQAELAAKVELSRTSITNIEKGRQPVQLHTAIQIADSLSTTISELIPSKGLLRPSDSLEKLKDLDPNERKWVEVIIQKP